MTEIQKQYTAAVEALRALGAALIPATAAQYLPPPGTVSSRGTTGEMTGISNPTLDTVLDGRRMGLSDEVAKTAQKLSKVAADLSARTAALRTATDRWEGVEDALADSTPESST